MRNGKKTKNTNTKSVDYLTIGSIAIQELVILSYQQLKDY